MAPLTPTGPFHFCNLLWQACVLWCMPPRIPSLKHEEGFRQRGKTFYKSKYRRNTTMRGETIHRAKKHAKENVSHNTSQTHPSPDKQRQFFCGPTGPSKKKIPMPNVNKPQERRGRKPCDQTEYTTRNGSSRKQPHNNIARPVTPKSPPNGQ